MTHDPDSHTTVPFPRIREAYVDVLWAGSRTHLIHGLIEADVTDVRDLLRRRTDEDLSLTAFLVACIGKAVDADKMLHAYRKGRRLILFDEVDVNVQVEETLPDGTRIVQSRLLRGVNRKPVEAVSSEIRSAQRKEDVDRRRYRATLAFLRLPRFLRRLLWRVMLRSPRLMKRYGGTVGVSAVGMFGSGAGWGIPITPTTLMVTVGGIGERPVLMDGEVETREFLSLTISYDHDIVDGAPAARFAGRLKDLIESADGVQPGREPA